MVLKKKLMHGQILSEPMLLETKLKNFDWNQNYKVCNFGPVGFGSYCVLKDEYVGDTKITEFIILVLEWFCPLRALAVKELIGDQNIKFVILVKAWSVS